MPIELPADTEETVRGSVVSQLGLVQPADRVPAAPAAPVMIFLADQIGDGEQVRPRIQRHGAVACVTAVRRVALAE
jgi:hypothetical protein